MDTSIARFCSLPQHNTTPTPIKTNDRNFKKGWISNNINLLQCLFFFIFFFHLLQKYKKLQERKKKWKEIRLPALSQFFLYLLYQFSVFYSSSRGSCFLFISFFIFFLPFLFSSNTSTPRGLIIYSVDLKEYFFFRCASCWFFPFQKENYVNIF